MLPFDIWRFPRLDPYSLLRPILFRMDAEKAHQIALNLLLKRLGPKIPKVLRGKTADDPILQTTVGDLVFGNPVGLAAGFDKNAEAMSELLSIGFGFIEIGTITPQPQVGNPKPRVFRIPQAKGIINRLGFNSDGMEQCLRRIAAWHDSTQIHWADKRPRGLVGINIGVNKDCTDPSADYAGSYKRVSPYAGYVAINISSPNTPGLRDLQARERLEELLAAVNAARTAAKRKPPVFIKIAPDLDDIQLEDVAAVAMQADVQGVIVSNTTVTRPGNIPADLAKEAGGLSGRPLFELSTNILARMYNITQGKLPLIGCGGIFSGADAYAKIRAGASLVQVYSALIYEGPGLVRRIKRDLVTLLRRDGFKSVAEAVGSGNK